jgi:hypothetical protein
LRFGAKINTAPHATNIIRRATAIATRRLHVNGPVIGSNVQSSGRGVERGVETKLCRTNS